MVYTTGIIKDLDRAETLEELQDNKLTVVCEKLDPQPNDRLLDIGCGWGTLAAFAHKNYQCGVLGITLSRNQTTFGNERIKKTGGDPRRARIEYRDYRDLPREKGKFTKIVSLEMAEVQRPLAFLSIANSNFFISACRRSPLLSIHASGLRPLGRQWHFRIPGRRIPSQLAVRGSCLVSGQCCEFPPW